MQRALIISTQSTHQAEICSAFNSTVRVKIIADVNKAIRAMDQARYDIIFADLGPLEQLAMQTSREHVLQELKRKSTPIEVVVMAGSEKIHQAVQWVKAGAADILNYPLSSDQVRLVTDAVAASALRQSELDYLRDQFWKADTLEVVRTKSAAMRDVFTTPSHPHEI
ncbi:MAG: hypothetical protein P8X96_13050 [Desulfobacteraceae bacterium]